MSEIEPRLAQASPRQVERRNGSGRKRIFRRAIGTGLALALVAGGVDVLNNQNNKSDSLKKQVKQATDEQKSTTRKLDDIDKQLRETHNELSRTAGIAQRLSGQNEHLVLGNNLKPVSSLPGYGLTVSQSVIKTHESASLQLIEQSKANPKSAWSTFCSATKVKDKGSVYVLSAQHCFKDQEGIPIKGGYVRMPEAVNVIGRTTLNYAIASPKTNPSDYRHSYDPIGRISGIAVDESNVSDWALLKVDPSTASKQFNRMPAIPLSDVITDNDLPIPGSPVTFYSMPDSNSNAAVNSRGVYLGRYGFNGGPGSVYDIVATNSQSPSGDACDYGGSGSTAVLPADKFTGPLSSRNSIGYGKYNTYEYKDMINSSISVMQQGRLSIESMTGLDLGSYATICMFTAQTGNSATSPGFNGTIPDLEYVIAQPVAKLYSTGK